MYLAVQRARPRLATAARPRLAMPFEAATMYLCATTHGRAHQRGRGSVRRPATVGDGATAVVADFDLPDAAARFRAAIADEVSYPVWTQTLRSGIRHRFEVHRVRVPKEHAADLLTMLADAWRRGAELCTNAQPVSPSSPRWRHRQDLATAVWRGMLLSGPAVRTRRGLRVRTPGDVAPVVVRAAQLLGVTAQMQYHPRTPVVCVDDEREVHILLSLLSLQSEPHPRPASLRPVVAGADAYLLSRTA